MCPQYGELGSLVAEIGPVVWGTPANFNGFCVLATLLQRRRSTKADQTLHNVWPSPGLLHYIYIFGVYCPLTEFCQVQNSLCIQSYILLYWQHHCTALQQRASAKLCSIEKRAPPIFGMAAITLGIGPHSSCCFSAC